MAELLGDQPHCLAFSFPVVVAMVDAWPALLGKLPSSRRVCLLAFYHVPVVLSSCCETTCVFPCCHCLYHRTSGRMNTVLRETIRKRGLLSNVLAESLFFVSAKTFAPAEGPLEPANAVTALAAERMMALWTALYAWGTWKKEAPTPKPLLERMLKPWLEEVPSLDDEDAGVL